MSDGFSRAQTLFCYVRRRNTWQKRWTQRRLENFATLHFTSQGVARGCNCRLKNCLCRRRSRRKMPRTANSKRTSRSGSATTSFDSDRPRSKLQLRRSLPPPPQHGEDREDGGRSRQSAIARYELRFVCYELETAATTTTAKDAIEVGERANVSADFALAIFRRILCAPSFASLSRASAS